VDDIIDILNSSNQMNLSTKKNGIVIYLRRRRRYYVFARTPELVCLSVCLCASLLRNACMDLDDMLRVDRVGTWTN